MATSELSSHVAEFTQPHVQRMLDAFTDLIGHNKKQHLSARERGEEVKSYANKKIVADGSTNQVK